MEHHIDMSPIVGKVLKVLMEPYAQFISKLHADGRVSDAEIQGILEQFTTRSENLADYLVKEMEGGDEADS